MKSRIKDTDMGFDSIVTDLETLGQTSVDVGFFDDGTMSADGEMSMVDLAELQMVGRKGNWDYNESPIPSRDFMSQTAIDNHDEIGNAQEKLVGDLIDKKTFAIQGAIDVGEQYGEMMKKTIDDFDTPPNAEATIEFKGFDNPLVDSGKMRDSVTVKLTENF